MRLKDKTALVTGAASGNGRAIATLFAQEGAKVVLADINKEGVEQVTADLQQKGCEVLSVVIDVTKESILSGWYQQLFPLLGDWTF